jgi:hypothetical protein
MIGYGLVSPSQTKIIAQRVCAVLGGGEEAVRLLFETAAAETGCGTIPDRTRHGAGRGLFQCDEVAFNDVVRRVRDRHVEAVGREFDFNVRELRHRDLNVSPLAACVVARLFYMLRPEAIPLSLKGRAEYWKKFYNTVAGKGSAADYIFRVGACERYY